MDEKISQKEVEQYSHAYATLLAESFFAKKEKITGPEIVNFSDIKQVNLFVVRELKHNWRQEILKLKSPYFDYQVAEVKEAMENLQNILSNHISISKNDFQPLLKSSVVRTLNLLLAPYDYFSDTLDRHGNGFLSTAILKEEVKYLKINQAPLENLVKRLEDKKADLVTGTEAFAMLDHILEEVNFTPEDVELYITAFSKSLPLNLDNFFSTKPMAPQKIGIPSVLVKVEQAKIFADPIKHETIKETTTVGENLAKQKVGKLKDNLTINQKFMFTKILFKGDFEIFSEAIDYLDSLDTLSRALAHLGDTYPHWDRESEEYEEFIEVLTKRFS
jgi:hypothetical protein